MPKINNNKKYNQKKIYNNINLSNNNNISNNNIQMNLSNEDNNSDNNLNLNLKNNIINIGNNHNVNFKNLKKIIIFLKKLKEENEKYINNYKEYLKKKGKKIKLNPIKIKFQNSKNKISENLKRRAKCYLNYLKQNNINEINITSERMEKAENDLNKFYNKVKIKTEKEFDKIYKEEIFI